MKALSMRSVTNSSPRSRRTVNTGRASLLVVTLTLACTPVEDSAEQNVGSTQQASELADSVNAAIPPEVKEIAEVAKDVASVFGPASSAISIATSFLKMAGVLGDSDPLQEKFDALNRHLDQVAGSLSWEISAFQRQNNLAYSASAVTGAAQILNAGGQLTLDSEPNGTSRNAVYAGEQAVYFMRYYNESTTDGPSFNPFLDNLNCGPNFCFQASGTWKSFFQQSYGIPYDVNPGAAASIVPPHSDGYTYDWRLGVPALLSLISRRVQVIAAIDNNFIHDDIFDSELQTHADALRSHAKQMVEGVKCTVITRTQTLAPAHVDYAIICADINTGHVERTAFKQDGANRINDADWYAANITPQADRLILKILSAMPLAAIDTTINTLDGYRNGGIFRTNFSPVESIIPSRLTNVNSGRCLDLAGSHYNPGAFVEQYHCVNGAQNQLWTFRDQRWPGYTAGLTGGMLVTPVSKDGRAGPLLPLGVDGLSFFSDYAQTQLIPYTYLQGWTFNRQLDGTYEILAPGSYSTSYSTSLKCMDVAGSSRSDYARVLQYHCTGNPNQRWNVQISDIPFHLSRFFTPGTSGAAKLCVDVGTSTSAYTDVVQNSCQNQSGSLFHLVDGGWVNGEHVFAIASNSSGLCLDVRGGSVTPGSRLIQYPCRMTSNQLWSFSGMPQVFQPFEIKNLKSGLCLDVGGGALTDGVQLLQEECTSPGTTAQSQTQQFLVDPYSSY